jgi:hypothetical protein
MAFDIRKSARGGRFRRLCMLAAVAAVAAVAAGCMRGRLYEDDYSDDFVVNWGAELRSPGDPRDRAGLSTQALETERRLGF